MQPPTKDQTDIGVENPTLDASDGVIVENIHGYTYESKDVARQEFAKEADINYMLSRFGVTPERGAPTYGEWDDSLDLQQAIMSVTEARAAYADLPKELRDKFGSMEQLIEAYMNGSLVIKDGDVPVPPKTEVEILRERLERLENSSAAPNTTDS